MAGHSQFKNIMHRKGAQDARRARAVRQADPRDHGQRPAGPARPGSSTRACGRRCPPPANPSMPRDTIERAVKKATGAGGGDDYVDVRYEGYGPSGVALIVEALTDNRNRTASDVRAAFNKHGGALGETNSVSFMFSRLGVILYAPPGRQRRRHAGGRDRSRRRQRRQRAGRARGHLRRRRFLRRARRAGSPKSARRPIGQAGMAPGHRRHAWTRPTRPAC